jgi:hypothetical protein
LSLDGGDSIGGFLQNFPPDSIPELALQTSPENANIGPLSAEQ